MVCIDIPPQQNRDPTGEPYMVTNTEEGAACAEVTLPSFPAITGSSDRAGEPEWRRRS
jgi:hypothetical protein